MDGGARLRVTLLGGFEVTRGGVVLPVPGTRLRSLLVRLALAGGRAVEPGVLVDAIWGEEPPSGAAAALQTLISRLRRALTEDPSGVVVRQVVGGYRLAVDAADVDALHFELLAAAGRERLRSGDPLAASAALAEALALWGDNPGAEPTVIAAVAPALATRLAQVSIEAVADLADAELSLGRVEPAVTRLIALLAGQPVHERAAALLMDALAAAGRQAEALAVYERVRESLADALGADPGTALRDRHLRLLRPAPAPTQSPTGSATSSAPGSAVSATSPAHPPPQGPPTNLPTPLTSFIGRDDDLTRIATLLTTGRLVTVLGPGGAGKTRLALEAARRHRATYRDGAWLIDLASVTEPAKLAAAVLAGIGLRGGALLDARTRVENDELDVLAGREILLLIDNCEHLIDPAAHLIAALLARFPGVRVLATSREPLAVDGEALVPLGPLTLPEPGAGVDEARQTPSVRLFVDRADAVRPGFEFDPLIVGIVRGLDGMPLALELAAARLRTLSLPELAAGLSDRFRLLTTGSRTAPPRQRTLRGVIAWSWELLDERERTVAERISVLPGGVTPASATAVCAGTAVPAADIPDLLAALVDRSLLQLAPTPGRYRMLETIREYGAGQLTDPGAVRDLATDYFTALLARYDPQLRGPGQLTAMAIIGTEYDNTLASLRHLCATHDSAGAIALALALTWYWQMSGRQSDGAYWVGEVLAVPGGRPSPERDCVRAVHLLNRADIQSEITAGQAADDRAEMRELAGRLLDQPESAQLPGHHRVFGLVLLFLVEPSAARFELLADGDDGWLSGLAHMFLAEIAENAGELDEMRAHVELSLARFRQAGDSWGRAATVAMRAQLRRYDDLDGALADLGEARALAADFGAPSLGDQLYSDLRWIDLLVRRGDTAQALAMIDSARERALSASAAQLLVLIDTREAGLRIRLGDLDRAGELLDAAGSGAGHARALIGGARCELRLALGDPSGADKALQQAYGAALETGELPVLAPVAVHAAALAGARGRHHRSAVLLGVAARLRGAHDHTDPQVRELTRQGRGALGDGQFTAAYAKGWEFDPETAVAAADPDRSSARVLVTGMSGAGKTTLLDELRRRGHRTVDTDYEGWESPAGHWDEERMARLLAAESHLVVSGTVQNQGHFYDRFEHVVLLSAPLDVLLERVSRRTNNPYGRTAAQQAEIAGYVRTVEPLLRRGATLELDGRRSTADLADAVEELLIRPVPAVRSPGSPG